MDCHALLPQGRGRDGHFIAELVRHGGEHVWKVVGTVYASNSAGEELSGEYRSVCDGRSDSGDVVGLVGPNVQRV